MTISMGKSIKPKWDDKRKDEALSKNNSKSVRFRIRVQQELEAGKEIEDFKHRPSTTVRVPDPHGE